MIYTLTPQQLDFANYRLKHRLTLYIGITKESAHSGSHVRLSTTTIGVVGCKRKCQIFCHQQIKQKLSAWELENERLGKLFN